MPLRSNALRAPFGLDLSFLALVRREALVLSRRTWPFLVLGVFVLLLCGIMGVMWGVATYERNMSLSNISDFSQILFGWLAYVYLIAGGLFLAFATAPSVVSERERETLELLLTAPVSTPGLVLSKALHPFAGLLLLLIGMAPILGLFFMFVGLEQRQTIGALGYATLAILAQGALALRVSAGAKSTARAAARSLLFLVAVWIGPFFLTAAAEELDMEELTLSMSPLYCLATAIYDSTFWTGSAPLLCFAFQGGLVAFGLWGAWLRLRRPFAESKRSRWKRFRAWLKRFAGGAFILRPWNPTHRWISISDDANPLFRRDFHWGFVRTSGGTVRTAVALFLLLAWLSWLTATEGGFMAEVVVVFLSIASGLILCVLAILRGANAFSREWERGTHELLRTTLLTPRQVVFGTLRGALARLAPFEAAGLFGLLPFLFFRSGGESCKAFAYGPYLFMHLDLFVLLAFTMLMSLAFRRTMPALVVSVAAGILLLGGPFLLMGLGVLLLEASSSNIPEELGLFVMSALSTPFAGVACAAAATVATASEALSALIGGGVCVLLRVGLIVFLMRALLRMYKKRMRDA